MSSVFFVFICFIPVVCLCLWAVFALKGFSPLFALRGVLAGLIPVIPVAALQFFFPRIGGQPGNIVFSLFSAFVISGLIEETVKTAALFTLPAKNAGFPYFFLMSVIAGFSFGCFETVVYIISGEGSILLRSVTAVLLHAACAGLDGIYVWGKKCSRGSFCPEKRLSVRPALPFVLSVLVHGLYNFFAAMTGVFWIFSIVCIAAAVNQCVLYYRRLNRRPD